MKKSHLLGAVCACLFAVPFNSNAALVNENWNGGIDNITRDTGTGLRWLDLTETGGLTRDYVITQLGSDGDFEGFRYATSAEVVTLWANFSVNLSAGAPTLVAGALDPNIETAASWLGNTFCEWDCDNYPHGVLGLTDDPSPYSQTAHNQMGAVYWHTDGSNNYQPAQYFYEFDSTSLLANGHYLVSQVPVPVPAALWLFGSGLLGLVGIARRKKA